MQEDPSDFGNDEICVLFGDSRSIWACHQVFSIRTDYGTLVASQTGVDVGA